MRELEVLAPAGNLEIFKSVINAGADAVYFGGQLFSARAFADNFDFKESREALEYAHLHGKKAYLTLNTLVKNKEFNDELFDYINFYYENGLDGIIVQDMGVVSFIRDNFPMLNVHASTQMAVCSREGVNLMEKLGLTRVVPARELSLFEIKCIHDNTNLELEVFVHGALCYCYSGDCLMSSLIGGRSGNRGRCAQPCRLEYDLYSEGKPVKTKGGYILSLKDLCGIDDLYNLYMSGVSSLKIEGRMKQKQYASNVVNVYRRYVDYLLNNISQGIDEYTVKEKEKRFLFDLGNRCGFTNSYYYYNTDDMVTFTRPNHQSKDVESEYAEEKLKVQGIFNARVGEEIELTVSYNDNVVTMRGIVCENASKKPVTSVDIEKRLKRTGDTVFEFEDVTINVDDNIFVPLGEVNRLRKEALEELKDKLLSEYRRYEIESVADSKDNCEIFNNYDEKAGKEQATQIETIEPLIISITNRSQLDAIDGINSLPPYDLVISVIDYELFKDIDNIRRHSNAKRIYADLPIVIRENKRDVLLGNLDILRKYDGFIVSGYDGIGFIRENNLEGTIIAGDHLYTYNNNALRFLDKNDIEYNISPIELNHKELKHRNNKNSILTIYGRSIMMITSNCINKNCIKCDKTEKNMILRDKKGHSFLVRNKCKMCYNIIYNDLPTCLVGEADMVERLGFRSLKIDFTDEDVAGVEIVIRQYMDAYIGNKSFSIDYKYTKGHFNRGVE